MPVHTVYTLSRDDAEARHWLEVLRRHCASLSGVVIERVYWLEGDIDVGKLTSLLVNPLYQTASSQSRLDPAHGPIVEIAYRPAVTDPETPSLLTASRAVGESRLEFARLSKRYQLAGVSEAEAHRLAARFLYNPVVERIREPGEAVTTLRPSGTPSPVTRISFEGLDDNRLAELSQSRSWYAPLSQLRVIQTHERQIGRPHTDAEIEILVQSWSDHCYHTTWKGLGLLKRLAEATSRIAHPLVVSAFQDNAGGMEFYEDWVVTIKGETHNFPSSIAPFGGVATKHGGVIRDTLGFGRGAYPIGGTTIMGTLDPRLPDEQVPKGVLPPQFIVSEAVRATAYYNNPMGIPMMHSLYRIHPGYAKCLALGHSIGLVPRAHALKERPQPGDLALLIGGETGRDGIHGATASSVGMSGQTLEKDAAAVQIGHPITQRKFTTAIPVLRDAGCIRSITDLGAGGISCAAGEMAAETGIWLDLDRVPLKDRSLTAWEILLSESQERMLLVIPQEKLAEAETILDSYEVDHATIGRFTDTRRFEAVWRGEKVVDLEMEFLWGACPIEPAEIAPPGVESSAQAAPRAVAIPEPRTAHEWAAAFHRVLGHYHCADQSAAAVRFDTTVQGRTVIGPYGGRHHRMPTNFYASAPLRGRKYGLVTTVAYNPFYAEAVPDGPSAMARLMMIEAITKAVVAGVDYRDLVLCDNFYTPRIRPEVAYQLKRMVETIADFSVEIGVPFISGKDSSSGTLETDGLTIDVPFTLVVAAMGRVPDVGRLVTKEFKRAGSKILLVGHIDSHALGGSVYADSYGQRQGRLADAYDATSIRALWDALRRLHRDGIYLSGSAIAEGGLALRLFESCLGSGFGVYLDLPLLGGERRDGMLFGEFVGSVLLEVPADVEIAPALDAIPYRVLGEVTPVPQLVLADGDHELWSSPIAELAEIWSRTFREVLE